LQNNNLMLTDEYRYRILKVLEADPQASQRRIANALGISLGRVNYCLQALIDKGLVKAKNFRTSTNKRAYLYLLTPKGMEDRAKTTVRFLKVKIAEYEELTQQLGELRREVANMQDSSVDERAEK
jgi:EPS-associated MarR family transcriptional regulator